MDTATVAAMAGGAACGAALAAVALYAAFLWLWRDFMR